MKQGDVVWVVQRKELDGPWVIWVTRETRAGGWVKNWKKEYDDQVRYRISKFVRAGRAS